MLLLTVQRRNMVPYHTVFCCADLGYQRATQRKRTQKQTPPPPVDAAKCGNKSERQMISGASLFSTCYDLRGENGSGPGALQVFDRGLECEYCVLRTYCVSWAAAAAVASPRCFTRKVRRWCVMLAHVGQRKVRSKTCQTGNEGA